MGKHMDDRQQALAYYYRNPPKAAKASGVKPLSYSKIAELIPGNPDVNADQVRMSVKRFCLKRKSRGRPKGFRKTLPTEDETILKTFFKVRQPLGKLVESRDVWSALPATLRNKVCLRTVRNRLREKGYTMDDKLTGDDKGTAWRKKRMKFCASHKRWTGPMWSSRVQGVGDFRFFTFFPKQFKKRHKVQSCPKTIMSKKEKTKSAFLKPKYHIFKRSEYKKCSKAKVFGLTTSNGRSLVVPCPLHPTSADFIKMLKDRVQPFLAEVFPHRSSYTLLLDGESIMHTAEAKAALKECGVRLVSPWPAHSPDLNPQENVWAWTEKMLRKAEQKTDTLQVFKRRIVQVSMSYKGKDKLVPSLAGRMERCLALNGGKIGK